MRRTLGILALVALTAGCAPPPGRKPTPKPAGPAPTAAKAAGQAGWMGWQGTDGPAAAAWPDFGGPKVVVRCDARRHAVHVIFPGDPPDQAIAHETLTVVGGKMSLLAEMRFRSPEDAAADDPPAWAEFAPFPPTRLVLAGDTPLRFERSDPSHPAIVTSAPNAALKQIVEACR